MTTTHPRRRRRLTILAAAAAVGALTLGAWRATPAEQTAARPNIIVVLVDAIDTSMGTLMNGLQSRGALDNTMILFLSDNGANAESGPDGRVDGESPVGRTRTCIWA
jgi:arylsulfatase A-like enzyme